MSRRGHGRRRSGGRSAREWARRAALSALAGGGLTAAPLTGGALAAETQPAPGTQTTAGTPGAQAGEGGSQTTTSTTTTSTTPAPATTPSSPTPAPTTTQATTPAPAAQHSAAEAGVVPDESHQQPAGRQPVRKGTSRSSSHAPKNPPLGGHPTRAGKHASKPATGGVSSPTSTAPAVPSAVTNAASGAAGNIAPAPQLAAGQAAMPAPLMAGSLASLRALSFYRIPLFLLPIYQAASARYGVPWPILAAINEVETDYGTDLNVSTAGAVGWMQFMPETWLQYGVDAVNAGYADPYNPVDAVFAAARYLHSAGAARNLTQAIFSYNHSEAYVQSVLLRARLIASYPASVIGTLTGLTEGSLPVPGATLVSSPQQSGGSASAEAQGEAAPSGSSASQGSGSSASPGSGSSPSGSSAASSGLASAPSAASSSLPGSVAAPAPKTSGASASALDAPAPSSQLSKLAAAPDAPVVAVEDGRIVGLGRSRKLGRYIVLRDTYGDVFTYAGLGSVVPSYSLPEPASPDVPKGALDGAEAGADPSPSHPATAGRQLPLTLHVAGKSAPKASGASAGEAASGPIAPLPAGSGKVRVFARPGNPDALAAARALAARSKLTPAGWRTLARGSLVAQGTLLGHLAVSSEDPQHSYMRFAVRPPGAQTAIDPAPLLQNWRQLDAALHPQGAKGGDVLAGATASDAFLLAPADLERAVLADPGIRLSACDRQQVASGKADRHVLGLLVFLSRSGLKPTVGELRCGHISYTSAGSLSAYPRRGTFTITAINGIPISGHQGAGTVVDEAIRTLLTVKPPFAPSQIVSLMQYPGVKRTVASSSHAAAIEIVMHARGATTPLGGGFSKPAARAATAHAAAAHAATATTGGVILGSAQWRQLFARIGGLAQPKVSRKPSTSAIRDRRH